MFHSDPAELGRKGAAARNRNLTPERRSRIATFAVYHRWSSGPGRDLWQIESHLIQLSKVVDNAQRSRDYRSALCALKLMLNYERLKVARERLGQRRESTRTNPSRIP